MVSNRIINNKKLIAICVFTFSLLLSGCKGNVAESADASTTQSEALENNSTGKDTDTQDISNEYSDTDAEEQADMEEVSDSQRITVEIGTNYIDEYNDDYNKHYLSMRYPSIRLSKENSIQYPELADSLNLISSKVKKSVLDSKDSLLADSISQNESYDDFDMTYTDESSINLVRADSRIVSFWMESYSFYGGAHGYGASIGYNLDPEKGDKIEQSEFITNYDKLFELIDEKLKKFYPNLMSEEGLKGCLKDDEDYKFNFVIGNEGVEFIFNVYELGCYAEGAQDIYCSFDELKGIINDKYLSDSSEYIEYFGAFNEKYVNGEPLCVFGEMDEYETYSSLNVTYGNYTYTDNEFWGFSIDPFIVSTKNGNKYLMIVSNEENDYVLITVLDINNGIKKLETLSGVRNGVFDEEDEIVYYLYQTDPCNYRLSMRTDILGTQDIYRYYSISDSGDFEPLTDYYTYSYSNEVTAKTAVSGTMVDNNLEEKDKLDILAKEKVVPVYTDNETYVIVKNEKGELIKLLVDTDYPISINGTEVDKLFNDIMYAG